MKSRQRSVATSLLVVFLAAAGIWLFDYSTPSGLNLNDDSIAYIAGARSILSGDGYRQSWLVSNEPTVHFPPGFPATLALIGYVTGLDPVRGARALNGLLFGLNIALTGWLAWRMTRSRIAGIIGAALVLLNPSLLYIHSRVMSEPLYIFLMLVSFLLLDLYLNHSRNYLLILLGVTLGWAYLARYAALSLLATMLSLMLILHKTWRKRINSFLIVAAASFPWVIAWSIRNRLAGGTSTNRVLGWHPITQENWMLAVETLSDFLLPVSSWQKRLPDQIVIGFLLLIGLAIFLWTLYKGVPPLFKPMPVTKTRVMPLANSLHIVAYMLALITTMTLFDPATKFQIRILSPIYISIFLLGITLAVWLWRKKNMIWKPIIIFFTVLMLGMFSYGQYKIIPKIQNDLGFADPGWQNAKSIVALQELPPDVLILTNEPGLVYFHTSRPTGVLPPPGSDMTQVKQAVRDGKIVIALFRVNRASDNTLKYYYEIMSGLYRTDLSRTWILSAFPEQETK